MKHILLPLLTLCSLTLFSQQKKLNNPTVVSQDKLKKVPTSKKTPGLDSIHLKPPKDGATSPSEIIYNDEQINAIINEALDYYKKDFISEQIIILIKDKYYLSLAQATRIMYNAYFLNYEKVRVDTSWPYDLQLIVSKAYGSTNLATITLLKQSGEVRTFPFIFFYFYFLSLNNPSHSESEIAQKISDLFKLHIDAGYTPDEIYAGSFNGTAVTDNHWRSIWIPWFVMGMKKAKISLQNIMSVFHTYGLFQYPGSLNEILLKAGYTQAEIDNATK